jgi:3-oxoacyl-[acyl-carrier protein] reductase
VRKRGVSVAQAARDLDVHENVLRKWVQPLAEDPLEAFPGSGRMKAAEAEIERLGRLQRSLDGAQLRYNLADARPTVETKTLGNTPLAGKTALVTGASRNIGRAIALRLAAAGSDVVVNTLQDRGAAEGVAAEIEAIGRRSLVQIADVVDRSAVDQMVQKACEAVGSIDILVCNASSRGQIDFLDLDHAAWRRVIDISLDGAFHCAQATLPGMIAKGWGRIITLGGISWHAGFKRRAHNLTGKSGLTGLTRALAVEFGDRGITANVIAPGAVATARPASAGTPPVRVSLPPVPREARVDEIASAALFLAHPEQAYLNGQIIHVNGGAYLGT